MVQLLDGLLYRRFILNRNCFVLTAKQARKAQRAFSRVYNTLLPYTHYSDAYIELLAAHLYSIQDNGCMSIVMPECLMAPELGASGFSVWTGKEIEELQIETLQACFPKSLLGCPISPSICWACSRKASVEHLAHFRICSSCHIARYCGKECQKQHWETTHKATCATLKLHRKLWTCVQSNWKQHSLQNDDATFIEAAMRRGDGIREPGRRVCIGLGDITDALDPLNASLCNSLEPLTMGGRAVGREGSLPRETPLSSDGS